MKFKEVFVKNRKLILLGTVILISVIIVAIYFLVVNKVSNNSLLDQNSNVSYPVISQPQPVIVNDGYNFKNITQFKHFKLDNLDQNFCMATSFPERPPVTIDIDGYSYKNGNHSMSIKVINNMNSYVNNSKDIKNTYDLYNKLLNNELTVETTPRSFDFIDTLPRPCDSSSMFAIDISRIDYPGTDVAYTITFAGSTQSVVNHTYLPMDILIVSRIGETYSTLSSGYFEYKDITKDNHLELCEKMTSYNYPAIDEFTPAGNKCVSDQYKIDLDTSKLNKKMNEMLSVFALK